MIAGVFIPGAVTVGIGAGPGDGGRGGGAAGSGVVTVVTLVWTLGLPTVVRYEACVALSEGFRKGSTYVP